MNLHAQSNVCFTGLLRVVSPLTCAVSGGTPASLAEELARICPDHLATTGKIQAVGASMYLYRGSALDSAAYILNNLLDRQADSKHPK